MSNLKDKNNKDKNAKVDDAKMKALQSALATIEKNHGKGSVMKFGDKVADTNIVAVPTGSLSLDIALGVGGVPRGRIIEIYGPESSGKTTVTLHIVAEMQKLGGIAAFIDAEHALDPVYAKKIGVDIDNLYISQPDNGEQALDIADEMVRSGAIDIIVIDSVAALVPRVEIEGDMGDSHMGVHARLMSQALRKLTAICHKNNCIIMFTNQLREKIGVSFGNPETTTGGRALKFYASVRLEIKRGEALKIGDKQVGSRTKVKVAKNKVAPPFRNCEFDIVFGEGISHVGDVLDLAADVGIVAKSGAWYSYGETRLGQGRENAKLFFLENPELCAEIEDKVRSHYELKTLDEIRVANGLAALVEPEPEKEAKPKKSTKKSKKDEDDEPIAVTLDDDEIDAIIGEIGLDEDDLTLDYELGIDIDDEDL